MLPDLTRQEIQLLNRFSMLTPEGRRELNNYMRFILLKQYRSDLFSQVLGNPLLFNGLQQAIRLCEREDVEVEEVVQKIRQLKFLYYQLLEKSYCKYSEILGEMLLEDSLKDWGKVCFENILDAAHTGRRELMRQELEEMVQSYNRLARREDRKKIVAV